MKRFVASVDWYGDTSFEPVTFVVDAKNAGIAAKRVLGWARSHAKKESIGDEEPLEPYIVGMVQLRLGTWIEPVDDNAAGHFQLVTLTD